MLFLATMLKGAFCYRGSLWLDENVVCHHSIESYCAALSCGTVYLYAVRGLLTCDTVFYN